MPMVRGVGSHLPAAGRGRSGPVGGGCGFLNLINPSGMYVALANSSRRQRSGVPARACPGYGWGSWEGPLSGRLGLRPGSRWSWPRKQYRSIRHLFPLPSWPFLIPASTSPLISPDHTTRLLRPQLCLHLSKHRVPKLYKVFLVKIFFNPHKSIQFIFLITS